MSTGAGGRGAEGGRGKVAVRGRSGRGGQARGGGKREEPAKGDDDTARGFKSAVSEAYLRDKWLAAEADKELKKFAPPGSSGNVWGGDASKKLSGLSSAEFVKMFMDARAAAK